MKKVAIIGHFGFGQDLANGQTIKTKIVTQELKKQLGESEILKIDTHGGVKAFLKLPFQTFAALKKCRNVVIFPAHNGVRIMTPILKFWNFFFKRKLHYVIIGGWLPELLKTRKRLIKQLKSFDGLYAETQTLKRALDDMGFANVSVMPNCKQLRVLTPKELVYAKNKPYKLCTFSRVNEQKGIADAIAAVKAVNESVGEKVYTLDIYGPIDNGQEAWFEGLQKEFTEDIRYLGAVPFGDSVDVLKEYFALLFPTRYYTEGVPGTVIDAYASGVPVVSSRWESCADIVEENRTGYVYEYADVSGLINCLRRIAETPKEWQALKENCLSATDRYLPNQAVRILVEQLG